MVRAVRLGQVMRRAIPMTEDQRDALHEFPVWDYAPGGPERPFENKASDWGYLDGRLVALDYPAGDVLDRWEGSSDSDRQARTGWAVKRDPSIAVYDSDGFRKELDPSCTLLTLGLVC